MITVEQFRKAQKIVDQYYHEQMVKEFEPKMIKQTCLICEKKFEGTVKIDICPNCYV